MINQKETFTRIEEICDVEDADQLASDLYGTEEGSESDDIREVYIAAWVNFKDMLDDGATRGKAFDALNSAINSQFPNSI